MAATELNLADGSVVVRSDEVLAVDCENEVLMMSIAQGSYFSLDPTAADIWRRLSEPMIVSDLIRDLTATYRGDPAVIASEIRQFLRVLASKELVCIRSA